jgi:alpha-L-fucosidase 2
MKTTLLALLLGASATIAAQAADLALRYEQPATSWMREALPIGNGHMAAMLFGGVDADQIQFNEESLWIGDEGDTGSYQAFGDVWVRFGAAAAQPATVEAAPTSYRRELDLNRAVHSVGFVQAGVKHRREAFASYPARVMAFRYTADKPGALTGPVELTDSHKAVIRAAGDTLTATGSLAGYTYQGGSSKKQPGDSYALALSYAAQVRVLNEGGTIAVEGDRIVFTGVSTLTLILSAGTDFLQDRTKGWNDAAKLDQVAARQQAASARGWDVLHAEHLGDYQKLLICCPPCPTPGRPAAASPACGRGATSPWTSNGRMARSSPIASPEPGKVKVRVNGETKVVRCEKNPS